jgi:hypothetical protein
MANNIQDGYYGGFVMPYHGGYSEQKYQHNHKRYLLRVYISDNEEQYIGYLYHCQKLIHTIKCKKSQGAYDAMVRWIKKNG